MRTFTIGLGMWIGVLSGIVAASPQQEPEEQIVGIWRGDLEKTREYLKLPAAAKDIDDDELAFVKNLTVEFGSDHALNVDEGAGEPMRGKWRFVKDEDGLLEFELIRDEEATPATMEFLDDNAVAISVKNEQAIVFSRVVPENTGGAGDQLIGTWTFDEAATKKLEANAAFDQQQIDEMIREAGPIVVTFNQDGSLVLLHPPGDDATEARGTWKASHADSGGKRFRLSLDAVGGPKIVAVEVHDDGRVRFAPDGEPSAVFVRKKE